MVGAMLGDGWVMVGIMVGIMLAYGWHIVG